MDNDTLIRKYLHGELSAEEIKELEKLASSDPEFAAELEIQSVYYADRASALKEELLTYKPQANRSSFYTPIIAILFVLGLLILGFLAKKYYFDTPAEDATYYAQNYLDEKHVAPTVLMGSQTEEEIWNQSVDLYNKGEYKQAGASFLKASTSSGKADQALLYAALSYLYSGDELQFMAKPIFKALMNKNSVFIEEAQWYLALLYIESGDVKEATKLLQEIVRLESWNYTKAQNVLEHIKE